MIKIFVKVLLSLVLVLNFFSCSSAIKSIAPDVYVNKTKDKFDTSNSELFFGSTIDIKPVTFGSSGFSNFRLRFEKVGSEEVWFVRTVLVNSSWIFVSKIKFLVDNNVYEFNSMNNPFREVGYPLGGTDIYEENLFIVSSKLIKAIESAKQISVRLNGESYYFDNDLNMKDIQKMKNFITYINKNVSKENTTSTATKNISQSDTEIVTKEKNLVPEYLDVSDINNFKVLLSKYEGKNIRMTLSLSAIITDKIAWFTDDTYGIISIQYDKLPNESLEILSALKKGEKCIIIGTANSNLLGNPGIVAHSIKKVK